MEDKVDGMKASEIRWTEDPTGASVGEPGSYAYLDGVEAFVTRREDGVWDWSVLATGEVSEWPECWNAGSGCKSVCLRKAASSLIKAARSYARNGRREALAAERAEAMVS